MKKQLPKNTEISTYFSYKENTFEKMQIPDGRLLVQIVHHWEDGELMEFGFQYKDGILRSGINPLDIVGIYTNDEQVYLKLCLELDLFLNRYMQSECTECAGK